MIRDKQKLTPRQVRAIFLDRIRSQYEIAEQYKISQALVSQIRNRKERTDVTDELPDILRIDHRALKSGCNKLSAQQARQILEDSGSQGNKKLAEAFGVHESTIRRIKNGTTYARHTGGLRQKEYHL